MPTTTTTTSTTGFDTARNAARDIGVEKVAPPRAVDNTDAAAITAFGQIGGELRKGALKGGLQQELADLAEVTRIVDEQGNIRDAGGPIAGFIPSDPEGAKLVKEMSGSFDMLTAARKQGKLSPAAVDIQAEKILREFTRRAPGFATDFRELARVTLGRDPTGATTRGLIELSTVDTTTSRPQTLMEKAIERADVLSAGGRLQRPAALQLVLDSMLAETRSKVIDGEIELGQIHLPRVIAATNSEFTIKAIDGLGEAFAQAEADGVDGLVDSQRLVGRLNVTAAATIASRATAMAESTEHTFTAADISAMTAGVNGQLALLVAGIESEDFNDLLKNDLEAVTMGLQIMAARALPFLTGIKEALGPQAVTWWMDIQRAARGDQKLLRQWEAQFPTLGVIKTLQSEEGDMQKMIDFFFDHPAFNLSKEALPNPGSNPKDFTDTDAALLDIITTVGAISSPAEAVFGRSLAVMRDELGKPQKSLSLLANDPNGFDKLTPEEVTQHRESLGTVENAIAADLVNQLQNSDTLITFRNGQLTVVNRDGSDITGAPTFATSSRVISQGSINRTAARSRIDPVNALANNWNKTVLAMYNADVRWLAGIGFTREQAIEQFVARVNGEVLVRETSAAVQGESLSPEIQLDLREAKTPADLNRIAQKAGLGGFQDVEAEVREQSGLLTDGQGRVFNSLGERVDSLEELLQ